MTMEECVHEIFTSANGNFKITTFEHMKKVKYNAIVGNSGHFDNEIVIAFVGCPPRRHLSPDCWMKGRLSCRGTTR